MNNEKTQTAKRIYAITLQTSQEHYGKVNRLRETYYVLLKLLRSYTKELGDFTFYPELISSEHLHFTPVHFHGTLEVNTRDEYLAAAQFAREFNKTWNRCNFDCKPVKDEGWSKYMLKDIDYTPMFGMPHLKITKKTLKPLLKWAKPKETGIAALLKERGEGGGEL